MNANYTNSCVTLLTERFTVPHMSVIFDKKKKNNCNNNKQIITENKITEEKAKESEVEEKEEEGIQFLVHNFGHKLALVEWSVVF